MSNNTTQKEDVLSIFNLVSVKDETDEDKNKEALQREAEVKNKMTGAEPGDKEYVPTSETKSEIAEQLDRSKKLTDADKPVSQQAETEIKTLKLGQLQVNPRNIRSDMDYIDPDIKRSIRVAGDFTNVPKVVSTGETNENGDTVYRIIGGNRSVASLRDLLRDLLEEKDVDDDEIEERTYNYPLDCMVRKFDGDESLQELLEIELDNVHMSPSPINEAEHYRELLEELGAQKAVASKVGKYQSQISGRLALLDLPDSIQTRVHIGGKDQRRKFSKLSKDELDERDIPHSNGELETISVSNAEVMLDLLDFVGDSEQAQLDAESLLIMPKVNENAHKQRKDDFERYLFDKAVSEGILTERQKNDYFDGEEEATGETGADSPVVGPSSDTGEFDDDESDEGQPSDSKDSGDDAVNLDDIDFKQGNNEDGESDTGEFDEGESDEGEPEPSDDNESDMSEDGEPESSDSGDPEPSDDGSADDNSREQERRKIEKSIEKIDMSSEQMANALSSGQIEVSEAAEDILATMLKDDKPLVNDFVRKGLYFGVLETSE